jgi:SAM-dependent methyltransferase
MSESPNYQYVLDLADQQGGKQEGAKILDFGCGRAQVVMAGLKAGFDIHGTDTFEGVYNDWYNQCPEEVAGKIHKIIEGRLPFEDNSFDVVISNQVFEHIPDYRPSLQEISRILKPGGKMIALFPVKETWYEGHVGLYFPHYLSSWPNIQYRYMWLCSLLGFGFRKSGVNAKEWAKTRQSVIHDVCFYHPKKIFIKDVELTFGTSPKSLMDTYVTWRISRLFKKSTLKVTNTLSIFSPLFREVCLRRAGVVYVIEKTQKA